MATKVSYLQMGKDRVYREANLYFTPNAQVKAWADAVCAASPNMTKIQAIMTWVRHNVDYVIDALKYPYLGGWETWQFPLETIADLSGDCEDYAFLVASALVTQGYSVYVMVGHSRLHGHAWVELHCTSGWYILETLDNVIVPESSRAMYYHYPHYQITPGGVYKTDW